MRKLSKILKLFERENLGYHINFFSELPLGKGKSYHCSTKSERHWIEFNVVKRPGPIYVEFAIIAAHEYGHFRSAKDRPSLARDNAYRELEKQSGLVQRRQAIAKRKGETLSEDESKCILSKNHKYLILEEEIYAWEIGREILGRMSKVEQLRYEKYAILTLGNYRKELGKCKTLAECRVVVEVWFRSDID